MRADCSVLEPNFVLPCHSLIAEFATILATLHNNQEIVPSWNPRLICSSLLPPPTLTTMAPSLNDLILLFYGRDESDEDRQQDPAEFIKNLSFAIDGQVYNDDVKKQTTT